MFKYHLGHIATNGYNRLLIEESIIVRIWSLLTQEQYIKMKNRIFQPCDC